MGQKFHFTPLECPACPVRINSNEVKKHGNGIHPVATLVSNGVKF